MDFAHCLHIVMVIGKYKNFSGGFFLVGGRGQGISLCGRISPRSNFSWGKRISTKGALDQKLNKKQFFSTESKE